MWTANIVTATFQYNDASGGNSTRDGMAYDVDHSTSGVTFQYNLSHDNAGGFFLLCPYDTPTKNFIIRDGISTQIVTENTTSPLNVQFTDNIVARHGSTGTVGWTLTHSSWAIDHNDLYDVPAPPSWATNTVTDAPSFAGRGATDPRGYELLSGSAALGAGTTISSNGGLDYFGNPVSATAAPNIGAVDSAAVCALPLLDTFDTDTAGAAPAGWTASGPAAALTVGRDPATGSIGNSLLITTQSTTGSATRGFTASGDLLADVRMRASQSNAADGFLLLDAQGNEIAKVSLSASGDLWYTKGTSWIDPGTTGAYTLNAWHRVILTLHQSAKTYDLTLDGMTIATAIPTNSAAGAATTVKVNAPAGNSANFAVDDVLVAPAAGC